MEQIIKYALSSDDRMFGCCFFIVLMTAVVMVGIREIVAVARRR